jgi:hypothetical protein
MPMPTSIFKFLPSTQPTSIASSVIGALPQLSGLPSLASNAINNGLNSLVNQFGLPIVDTPGGGGSADNTTSPLKDFLEDMKWNGVAWTNRFHARINIPAAIKDVINTGTSGPNDIDEKGLMLRCDMAELPGTTYAVSEARHMGPSFKRPVTAAYSDLSLTFIMSTNMVEKYFFDYWAYVIKDQSDLYSYYNDIVTNIEVTLYTAQNGQPVYGVKFLDAWPISINPIQLSWQDQDIMKLSVSFAYHRWEPVSYPMPDFASQGSLNGDLTGSFNLLSDFAFGILPSIPGASRALGLLGMSSRDMVRSGVSLIGQSVPTRDPISRTIIGAGTSTINKLIGKE